MTSVSPVINPEISSFFSRMAASIKDKWSATNTKLFANISGGDQFSLLALFFLLVLAIGVAVVYFKKIQLLETPGNIARITTAAAAAQTDYDNKNPKRMGLNDYLDTLKKSGVPESHFILTNFYVSTVNATGLFFPAKDGVISPMAVRSAVAAGARAFVIDVWPDLLPGKNFAPIVQTVESGSAWRRISLNYLPLESVLTTLIKESIENTTHPGSSSPVILYLRFRGSPRSSTFQATANILQTTMEPYRLPAAYYNCRNQDKVCAMSMKSLKRKVVVISNTRAAGTNLADYINVGPRDGIKLEYATNDPHGLSDDAKKEIIRKIKTNLAFMAPLPESDSAEANDWSFRDAQEIGIHFCAMNFWNHNKNLDAYMAPSLFGNASFAIKPLPLRYIIETIPDPKYPQDPKWGTGTNSGSPTIPPPIRMP